MVSARRLTALVLAAVLISGCAPAAPLDPGASEPSSTTAPAAGVPWFAPRPGLSLDLVPGTHEVVRSDEVHRIFARWFAVPGHPEVERAQQAAVDASIDAFRGAPESTGHGGGTVPRELSIESELTGSSAEMLGIRSTTTTISGDATSKEYRTQWFDLNTGRMLETRELFADAQRWARFRDLVDIELLGLPEAGEKDAVAADSLQLLSLNFDASGDALVEFGEHVVAPGAVGDVVVKVPSTEVSALLGNLGRQAREAGMRPTGLPASKGRPLEPVDGSGTGSHVGDPDPGDGAEPDCRKVKCVALTFDDGPGPKTGQLLDVLKQADALATFFVVGPNAQMRPKTLVRMLEEGHEIGNHTWHHRVLTSLAPEGMVREIGSTARAVKDATGVAPTLMRPPYGATNAKVKAVVDVPLILWDVDTLDWKVRNAQQVVANAVRDTKPGSIVLMHDIHSSTIEAVPAILRKLGAQGFHFVTVSQLLASVGLTDGVVYARGPAPAKTPSKKPAKALAKS